MSVSVALTPFPILQFFDNAGNPAIGGSLTTQVGGINYATYSEPTGTTALPNPIPLNSRGEVSTAAGTSSPLYLQVGVSYTFILKDRNGNQLWSVSNIYTPTTSNPVATGSANAQVITNVPPITAVQGSIQWFFPVAANTGATTLNVDNNGAKNLFYLSKALVGGELQSNVPALAIYDGTQWNLAWSAKGPVGDYYVDSGTVNNLAFTINMAQTITVGNITGLRFKGKVSNTNTSSALVTLNGAGPWTIYLQDKTTTAPVGSLVANTIYDFIFDGGLAGLIVQDPTRVKSSFTGTMTGVTGSVTATVNYVISPDGNTATLLIPQFSGTSNATTCTITGAPTLLAPTTTQSAPCYCSDAGTAGNASITMTAGSSVISFFFGSAMGTGAFTNSGTKICPRVASPSVFIFTYALTP